MYVPVVVRSVSPLGWARWVRVHVSGDSSGGKRASFRPACVRACGLSSEHRCVHLHVCVCMCVEACVCMHGCEVSVRSWASGEMTTCGGCHERAQTALCNAPLLAYQPRPQLPPTNCKPMTSRFANCF